jgi:hypothetical protein
MEINHTDEVIDGSTIGVEHVTDESINYTTRDDSNNGVPKKSKEKGLITKNITAQSGVCDATVRQIAKTVLAIEKKPDKIKAFYAKALGTRNDTVYIASALYKNPRVIKKIDISRFYGKDAIDIAFVIATTDAKTAELIIHLLIAAGIDVDPKCARDLRKLARMIGEISDDDKMQQKVSDILSIQ